MNIFVIYKQNFRFFHFFPLIIEGPAEDSLPNNVPVYEDQLMETEDEDSGYDSMCEDEEDSKEDDDIRPCAPLILQFPPENLVQVR